MIGLPVILRELRVGARSQTTYRIRLLAGLIVTASFALTAASRKMAFITGTQLFNEANIFVLGLIWLLAPLLTADCLSREKREGTLGLLFLTPLTPVGAVVGKSFVHGMRASTFLLAAAPVMAIGVLLGGVSASAIVMMLLHHLGALALALAAGLLASSWTRQWIRSILLAGALTFLFGYFYYQGMGLVVSSNSLVLAALLFAMAAVVLLGSIGVAAWSIRQSWQEIGPSAVNLWWLRTFCSPIFWRGLFRRSMQRSLERNPIGWLHQASTTVRVSKWVWCGGAILAASWQILGSFHQLEWFHGFQLALAMAMAFAGAASFRRERQNGVMELILVSPLETGQIIDGRLRAIWRQFLPAAIALVFPLILLLPFAGPETDWIFAQCLWVVSSMVTLPELGFCVSFRTRQFLTAWIATCLVAIAVPYAMALVLTGGLPIKPATFKWMAVLQVCVGRAAIEGLKRKLTRHTIAFQET